MDKGALLFNLMVGLAVFNYVALLSTRRRSEAQTTEPVAAPVLVDKWPDRCECGNGQWFINEVTHDRTCTRCAKATRNRLTYSLFVKKECPDCGCKEYLEGPSGGAATNIKCADPKCGSKFNICPMASYAERIN